MTTIGSFTRYIDLAQVILYGFWVFFFALVYYLRREDKREGYPLESDRSPSIRVQGFPAMPPPKVFRLRSGATYQAPPGLIDTREIRAAPTERWPGAPLQPSGDPMLDAVGPASYTEREDKPDLTFEGELKIVPLRVAHDFFIAAEDPDPKGMAVIGADGVEAGKVAEVWIDRSEPQIRYLEVEVRKSGAAQHVLLPITFTKIDAARRRVRVASILAAQFANVPSTASAEKITLREEDRICGYFAGGHLYATPERMGPVL